MITSNFFIYVMLRDEVIPFSGVDVSNMSSKEEWERGNFGRWYRRERNMIGLTDYTYHACQAVIWAKTIYLGNMREKRNLFKWDREVVNLTGSESYDRNNPWLYKERKDGMITSNLFIYVDGGRPIGPTEKTFWEASWR